MRLTGICLVLLIAISGSACSGPTKYLRSELGCSTPELTTSVKQCLKKHCDTLENRQNALQITIAAKQGKERDDRDEIITKAARIDPWGFITSIDYWPF